MIKSYKDLLAWQKSMDLVEMVYEITRQFPREELFGLATSLRRATVSIPSKIAAGHERDNTREYIQHLASARGSLSEAETQMEVAKRLAGYINDEQQEQFNKLASDTGKIINGLMNSMERYAVANAR
jgi:four helix bundle protein